MRGVTADVRAIAQRHGVTVDTGCPAACAEQRARALLELAARARACGSGQRLRLCCSCELDERCHAVVLARSVDRLAAAPRRQNGMRRWLGEPEL